MKKELVKTSVIFLMVLIAAFSRLIPHPSNFTTVGAMAVFAGLLIPNRTVSAFIPLSSMWLSDIVLNNLIYHSSEFVWFTSGILWIYGGILAHSAAAWFFKKPETIFIAGSCLLGAVVFFLLSNFGVWTGSDMYDKTFSGLIRCYTAALPFFGNMLAGNLIFCAALFGIYFILEKQIQIFRTVNFR